MKNYKDAMRKLIENKKIIKLYFDNILIRENWAALHYRYRREDKASKEKSVGDRMQFLKLEVKNDVLKIVACWTQ